MSLCILVIISVVSLTYCLLICSRISNPEQREMVLTELQTVFGSSVDFAIVGEERPETPLTTTDTTTVTVRRDGQGSFQHHIN